MALQCLSLSSHKVPVTAPVGYEVGVIQGRQPNSILALVGTAGGVFRLVTLKHGTVIKTAQPIDPMVNSYLIKVRETEQYTGHQFETGMIIHVDSSLLANPGAAVTTIPVWPSTVGPSQKLQQIKTLGQDPSLVAVDEADSIKAAFEAAIRHKPAVEKNVVIPKTCIALYSEEHAQLPFACKTVNVLDGTVVKEARATHLCPPDDRHAYQELYPDAVVLGICVRNGLPT